MNSNYILPISVAAAVHAVALFGFTKTPRAAVRATGDTIGCIFPISPPVEEIIEMIPVSNEENSNKDPVVAPPIAQPEPLVTVIEPIFKFTPPKIDPSGARSEGPIVPINLNPGDHSGPSADRGPILPGDLDNSPRTRFQTAPNYPHSAKMAGLTGEVLVEFTVDEGGRVIEPHVVRSTDRMFEEPTLRAVAKWQFEPGRRAGRIVRFRMAVPVVFNLNE